MSTLLGLFLGHVCGIESMLELCSLDKVQQDQETMACNPCTACLRFDVILLMCTTVSLYTQVCSSSSLQLHEPLTLLCLPQHWLTTTGSKVKLHFRSKFTAGTSRCPSWARQDGYVNRDTKNPEPRWAACAANLSSSTGCRSCHGNPQHAAAAGLPAGHSTS